MLLFFFNCFFCSHKQYGIIFIPLGPMFLPYFNLIVFHASFIIIQLTTSNPIGLPSTFLSSNTLLLITSYLMLFLEHSHIASIQRLVILKNFLVFQPYIVRIEHCMLVSTYMSNCFTPTQRSFQYCHIGMFFIVLRQNVVLPSLSSRCFVLEFCQSSPTPSTTTPWFVGPSRDSSIATCITFHLLPAIHKSSTTIKQR